MSVVDIASLNVRGLSNTQKRREVFYYMHAHEYSVIMLQETHSQLSDEAGWRAQWGGSMWLSHRTKNSAGVAILISKQCNYEIHKVIADKSGRFIILDITISEQRLTLVNIYGPNKDDHQFFVELMDQVEQLPNDNRIFGGDFNIVLDMELDRKGGAKTTHFKSQEVIRN